MAMACGARPVSGEVLSASAAAVAGGAPAGDIVDAEFETVLNRTGTVAPTLPAARATGMELLRRPSRPASAGLSRPFLFGTTFLALGAFWMAGGHDLAAAMLVPQASVPAAAIRIAHVSSRIEDAGAGALLLVDGEAANDGSAAAPLPSLELRVTATDGRLLRYRLGTAEHSMAPGAIFAFSSRLEVPKNGVKTVSVVFAE